MHLLLIRMRITQDRNSGKARKIRCRRGLLSPIRGWDSNRWGRAPTAAAWNLVQRRRSPAPRMACQWFPRKRRLRLGLGVREPARMERLRPAGLSSCIVLLGGNVSKIGYLVHPGEEQKTVGTERLCRRQYEMGYFPLMAAKCSPVIDSRGI